MHKDALAHQIASKRCDNDNNEKAWKNCGNNILVINGTIIVTDRHRNGARTVNYTSN